MSKKLLLAAIAVVTLSCIGIFFLMMNPLKGPVEEQLEIVNIDFEEDETGRYLVLQVKNNGSGATFVSEIRIWQDKTLYKDVTDLHISTSVEPASAVEGHRIRVEPEQTVAITVPKISWISENEYKVEVITSSGNAFTKSETPT